MPRIVEIKLEISSMEAIEQMNHYGWNGSKAGRITGLVLTMAAIIVATTAPGMAQEKQVTPKAVAFTTAPKLVIAKLRSGDQDVYDVRGKVTFTVTAANSDDTVAGTINYTIPDDARQKISQLGGKPINTIKSTFTQANVIASFQPGTGAPLIHLVINPIDAEVNGVKMRFNRIVVDINAREGGSIIPFTAEEMEALFTVWTRQINNGRARRGIIARMNRTINGESDQ